MNLPYSTFKETIIDQKKSFKLIVTNFFHLENLQKQDLSYIIEQSNPENYHLCLKNVMRNISRYTWFANCPNVIVAAEIILKNRGMIVDIGLSK